jgi:hypothetical protein
MRSKAPLSLGIFALLSFLAAACSGVAKAPAGDDSECSGGASRACVGAENCSGTETCSAGQWDGCRCDSAPPAKDSGGGAETTCSPTIDGSNGDAHPMCTTVDAADGGTKDAPEDASDDSHPMKDAPSDIGSDVPKDVVTTDSVIPTTCTEADNAVGCCAGNVLYYCMTTTLATKTCTGSEVCGWDSSKGYYDCVAAPGGADPSGTYPLACE